MRLARLTFNFPTCDIKSAPGHKQTSSAQRPMSEPRPKADIAYDSVVVRARGFGCHSFAFSRASFSAINARISSDMFSGFNHCSLYKVTGNAPFRKQRPHPFHSPSCGRPRTFQGPRSPRRRSSSAFISLSDMAVSFLAAMILSRRARGP
jgi:hypothetical protein